MGMGHGVRTGLGHGGITCVLQTQFSSFISLVSLDSHANSYVEKNGTIVRKRLTYKVKFYDKLYEKNNNR